MDMFFVPLYILRTAINSALRSDTEHGPRSPICGRGKYKFQGRAVRLYFFFHFFLLFFLSVKVFAADYPQYKIEATIDVVQKKISAFEIVQFTNTTLRPLKEIFFHIYPNRRFTDEEKKFIFQYGSYFKVNPFPEGFQSGKMDIRFVQAGQQVVSFSIEGEDQTLLRVPLAQELHPGETLDLKIDFTVHIPHAYGRFGFHENIFALSRWYPILSVVNDDGWDKALFYPFHRPFFSAASYYSVKLQVPQNYVVIHSGNLKNAQEDSSAKILQIETTHPVREFTIAMSPDYRVIEQEWNGVKIKSFYLPGNEFHAKEALKDVTDVMKFYSDRFGPYPYEEFSIAPVYLGYGGEQMANMSFIDTRVYQLPKILLHYFDFLVAHETGHQWFFNLVGVDEFESLWMEEGVNCFFQEEYLENKYGSHASPIELPKWLSWLLPEFTFHQARDVRYKMIARTNLDHPIAGKLSDFREPSSIFSLTYGKGSAVVGMLRDVIGKDAFDRVFRRVFEEFRFKNFSQDDFIRICEEESGKDLKWFFHEWLETTEHCDYSVDRVSGNKVQIVDRALLNSGHNIGGIHMPLKVKVRYQDDSEENFSFPDTSVRNLQQMPSGTGPVETMAVMSTIDMTGPPIKVLRGKCIEIISKENKPIRQVILDPDEELLDIDRTNNFWPRRIYIKPVPLYIGLYDIPVFLPDDAYNLVVGPEVSNSGLGLKASFQKPYDWNFYGATDYEFGEDLQKSRVGYQLNNVFHSQTTAGFELFNTTDYDGGKEDLAGGRVYLRKELWPAAYGLGDINNHVTLYLLRDRSLWGDLTFGGLEDSRNTSYLRKDEAIVGSVLHLGRFGPYPDPVVGYKLDTLLESSGHFLGATQYFYRGETDLSFYQPVTVQSKLALRLKYGWGYPDDKNLFELGGINGLRGFDRKTIRGAHAGLGSVEYRFPLVQKLNLSFADHLFGLESIGGVAFFDAGEAWFHDIDDTQLRKDAGLGLRFTVNLGSFLEKILVRLDAAQPIGVSKQDTHFWFGVNHAF